MISKLTIEVTSAVCSSVAISSTFQRIWIRFRGPGLWFDDAWAIFATLALVVYVAGIFTPVPSPPSTIGPARYYMLAVGFYMVIWPARLSILCSLIRLEHFPARRRLWKGFGVLFIFFWIGLLVQLFWECETNPGWKQLEIPQCRLRNDVAIAQLVTDVFADGLLLWIPMRLFRSIMSRNLRKRLMLIFSTVIMTTIVSLVHATFILVSGGLREIIAAIIEVCVSLIVCNFPLCIAQIFRRGNWFEDEDPITSSMWPSWLRNTVTTPAIETTTGAQPNRNVVSVSLPPQTDHSDPEDTESHSMKDFTPRSANTVDHA